MSLLLTFGKKSVIQRAISVLRQFGTDAHAYIPGVGVLNGLTAGNYTDSARTTPGSKDQPVGGVTDALDGIHATQGAAGNKPVLRQGNVNLLLNSATLSTQSVAVAASPHTLSFTGTGTVTKSGTATGALVGTGATDRVTQTFTPTAGTLTLTVTGSVTSAQLQLGSTATTYIPTTSAKASAGTGPQYWEFGGDMTPTDYLSLGSLPFIASDDYWVVAAFSLPQAATANQCVFGLASTSSSSPVSALWTNSANLITAFWRGNTGAVSVSAASGALPINTPIVASMLRNGNDGKLRVGGSQIGGTVDVSTVGTTTVNTATIGALQRSTFAQYWPGNIYAVLCGKGTISDADLLLIEKLAANLAGVTL